MGKYPTDVSLYSYGEVLLYLAIARSIQQDRGWIIPHTARMVEVSTFFIIWHCTFVKKWKRGHTKQSPLVFLLGTVRRSERDSAELVYKFI